MNKKAKKVAGKHAEQCVLVEDVNHEKRKLNQNIIYCFARLYVQTDISLFTIKKKRKERKRKRAKRKKKKGVNVAIVLLLKEAKTKLLICFDCCSFMLFLCCCDGNFPICYRCFTCWLLINSLDSQEFRVNIKPISKSLSRKAIREKREQNDGKNIPEKWKCSGMVFAYLGISEKKKCSHTHNH